MKTAVDRLRRVTDLFVEGKTLFLGLDDDGKPVTVWVNKLNSFEVEESRRDAVSARGLRLLELVKTDNPERQALMARVERWSDEELIRHRVDQLGDEIYLETINDLESDKDWAENIEIMRRLPQLLADSGAPEDDPRRKQLDDLNTQYLQTLSDRLDKATDDKAVDLAKLGRENLVEDFMESWRSRLSLDEFMQEKRATELYAAMRECQAEDLPGLHQDAEARWNHAKCDHRTRLLDARAAVKLLPEPLLEKVIETLEEITAPDREAGNSDAPVSSSAPSEQDVPAEASPASTPTETSPDVPTT